MEILDSSATFQLREQPINPQAERERLGLQASAGAYVSFEGWVRNHQGGRSVQRLNYQAHVTLANKAGAKILQESATRHGLLAAAAVHRLGLLEVGEIAVWVGVCAAHRDAAFAACREIIDRIKAEVPIWKHEHYLDNEKTWVGAENLNQK